MPDHHHAISPLHTGQLTCHDADGRLIPCPGCGQDAAFHKGTPWPVPRFRVIGPTVIDRLTGLVWLREANVAEFPLTWQEALTTIATMNRERTFGFSDWRLPNRHELGSLLSYQSKKPALPAGHPFVNVFNGWYWTSTTAAINTAYAWYIHMEGARMFYGHKGQFYLLWPVRGEDEQRLPVTGQTRCYDSQGELITCAGSGQDGELQRGLPWPEPRFQEAEGAVIDRLTTLCWHSSADLTARLSTWQEALAAVAAMNRQPGEMRSWRLPNINELESLVDCSTHSPALPLGHPFREVREAYWSSTTSMFMPDWAWALYLTKGAVGVGHKRGPHFSVWPVCDLGPRHLHIHTPREGELSP